MFNTFQKAFYAFFCAIVFLAPLAHAARRWEHCASLVKTLAFGDFQYFEEQSFFSLTQHQLAELIGKNIFVRTVGRNSDAALFEIKIHRAEVLPKPVEVLTSNLLNEAQQLYEQDGGQRNVDRRMYRIGDVLALSDFRYSSYEVFGAVIVGNDSTPKYVPFVSSLNKTQIREKEIVKFVSNIQLKIDQVPDASAPKVYVAHTHPCFSCVSYEDVMSGHTYIEDRLRLPSGSELHFYAVSQIPERVDGKALQEIIAKDLKSTDVRKYLIPAANFLVEDIRNGKK